MLSQGMTSGLSDLLRGWLAAHPSSYLEEQHGKKQRRLLHKNASGMILQDVPLTVEAISVLMELNWDGVIERRAVPGSQGLHIYDPAQAALTDNVSNR